MSLYRYSRWDGSQQLPPFDADDVLDALADDVLADGDIRRALQRLMQRGLRGTRGGDMPGLRRIVDRLRQRRQAELEQSNLDGVLDELAERLGRIVEQERDGIEQPRGGGASAPRSTPRPARRRTRPRMAEQVLRRAAQQRRDRLDALPPDLAGAAARAARLRVHGPRPPATPSTPLTDELRQHLLETYFQGLKEGVAGLTPEDLDGVRADGPRPQLAPREACLRRRYPRRVRRFHGAATASTSRRASATSTS